MQKKREETIVLEWESSEIYGKKIPTHTHQALIRYIRDGIPTGDFLHAVLNNDLREALLRADSENFEVLELLVRWLVTHAPSKCWGSAARVEAWIEQHRTARK